MALNQSTIIKELLVGIFLSVDDKLAFLIMQIG